MKRVLVGRSVLTVEDEPLVALDLMEELKSAGARAILAQTVGEALSEVECPNLSAAILDHRLMDGASSQVCERLKERGVPFFNHSGYGNLVGACSTGLLVTKPAKRQELVTLIRGLLGDRALQNMNPLTVPGAEPGTVQTP